MPGRRLDAMKRVPPLSSSRGAGGEEERCALARVRASPSPWTRLSSSPPWNQPQVGGGLRGGIRWALCALLICALATCALLGCARTPTPTVEPERLRLTGSTAAAPLLCVLSAPFQEHHPGVVLSLDQGSLDGVNASLAHKLVAEGAFPLAVVAGSPGDDLWAAPLAVDALAVIVHADNPLDSLTLAQLRQVFSGRIWRWSELEARVAGGEILVASREAGSGTRAAFEDLVLRERPEQAPAPITTMAVLRLSSAEVAAYVAEHPAAIGYLALGALEASSEQGPVKPLAVEGVVPAPEQVSGGAYPLF